MMRRRHITSILTLAMALIMSMAMAVSAETYTVDGECYFDASGDGIVSDFDSSEFIESISNLEPGDDVTFNVDFRNDYDGVTHWYMRNKVLETLEESYDRTQNGGYTYRLTHVAPDGKKTVLFDNSEVGGETVVADMEGMHQATNATEEWFFIQDLKKGETGHTQLYVKYDGETEVNDYMDTYSALQVAYAVELDNGKRKTVKTGDTTDLLTPVIVFVASLLLLILTIMSFRRDRRAEAAEGAGASGTGRAGSAGRMTGRHDAGDGKTGADRASGKERE